jgi:hypothetical protein
MIYRPEILAVQLILMPRSDYYLTGVMSGKLASIREPSIQVCKPIFA